MTHKPFLTGLLCRCQDRRTLVSVANWSPYRYQRSTTKTGRESSEAYFRNIQPDKIVNSEKAPSFTFASNRGKATANISVTRVRSSSCVFFSFAVRTFPHAQTPTTQINMNSFGKAKLILSISGTTAWHSPSSLCLCLQEGGIRKPAEWHRA